MWTPPDQGFKVETLRAFLGVALKLAAEAVQELMSELSLKPPSSGSTVIFLGAFGCNEGLPAISELSVWRWR